MAQYGKGVVTVSQLILTNKPMKTNKPPNKKRELEIGNEGKATSRIPANPPVFKCDLVNCLAEFSNVQNEHTAELFTKHAEQTQERTKVLLAQHVEEQQHFTKRALGKFAEQVEAKFEVHDARIDCLEAGASKDQSAIEELKLRMAACESNQAKQAQLLQMADANGCISRAEFNLGEFDRPISPEVLKILSPKFVSTASIQNSITPFVSSC